MSRDLRKKLATSPDVTQRRAKAKARPKRGALSKPMVVSKGVGARSGRNPDDIVSEMGARVREFRAKSNLSLSELADQSGVSRAMLSKVERGEKSPTLAIIWRISIGLGISISELMGAAPDASEVALIPFSQRMVFIDPESGFERHVLSPQHIDRPVEFVLHKIPPGKSSGVLSNYKVPTEKYLVVVAGTLTVQIGENRHTIKRGDSFYFEIKEAYKLVNEGATACEYYMVIVKHP
jgi:transcriptional regulator with XRE-family HTH domain